MAASKDPANMKAFGRVMTEMFLWLADNKLDMAEEWLWKLSAIKWNQYLTKREAEKIVSDMPCKPWTYDVWQQAMEKAEMPTESEPCYNSYALWVTMNAILCMSGDTISKYVGSENVFSAIYDLAVDKLTSDKYMIRHMYGL